MALTLAGINRFPVKSCRGEAVETAVAEPWGLAGDRRWMVVDEGGEAITARTVHSMLLIRPRLVPGGMVVSADGEPDLQTPQPSGHPIPVTVHGNPLRASSAGPTADAWFTRVIGRPARLVYLDDPTGRPTSSRFTQPQDRVSFADGYPIHLVSEASLGALNELIAAGPLAEQGPLPALRFRPNLVVSGGEPWVDDGWRRIRIGAAQFRVVKGCDRCVMTTLDPETLAKGKEPIATLARHRRWDGATWFGMDLITDTPGATIAVGDQIEVLESVDAPDGPPR